MIDVKQASIDAAKVATWEHINRVQTYLALCAEALIDRTVCHDQSKLHSPEAEVFAEFSPKLKGCTYGSDKYKQFLKEMAVALDHHYAANSHHPEHFVDGVNGMSLLDLIEMLCDWKAASERHDDGNIMRSIELNTVRFKLDLQMVSILKNTARRLWA